MILLVHLVLGALIGQKLASSAVAIILALLSHYFLDLIPHVEYDINGLFEKQWRQKLFDASKIALDLSFGIFLIATFSKNTPVIYICAFFAVLPDGFTLLKHLTANKFLEWHYRLHQKIHFLKNKDPEKSRQSGTYRARISNFWRISSQILVTVISVILLKI